MWHLFLSSLLPNAILIIPRDYNLLKTKERFDCGFFLIAGGIDLPHDTVERRTVAVSEEAG